MCLAPLILAGALIMTHFGAHHHPTDFSGGALIMQTCETGLALDVKASTSGLYGLGLAYGVTLPLGPLSLTLTPKAGLAYIDRPTWELAHPGNFEVGGSALLGYGRARVGLEYWHMSNAHTARPNSGLDLFVLETGWTF